MKKTDAAAARALVSLGARGAVPVGEVAVIEPGKRRAPGGKPKRTIGPLELRFVEKYVETLSVGRAYTFAADYHGPHATKLGLKWLARPEIQAAIEVRQHEVAAEMKVTPQEIVRRMMLIGYANPQALVDESGNYLSLKALPEDVALALSSVKVLSKRPTARRRRDSSSTACSSTSSGTSRRCSTRSRTTSTCSRG
jgi:hypothetical protein